MKSLGGLAGQRYQSGEGKVLVFVLVFPTVGFGYGLEALKSGVATYRVEVLAVSGHAGQTVGASDELIDYLADNLKGAIALLAEIEKSQGLPEAVEGLGRLQARRIKRKDSLLDTLEEETDLRIFKLENDSWRNNVAPLLAEDFVKTQAVRARLFDLKYFEEDDPRQANIVEGWLNGRIDFLKFEEEGEAWYRQEGVSKWEATFRVEPLVLLENDNHPGVLLAGGLLYNFFPQVDADERSIFEAEETHDFLSRYIKRAGFRLGAGASFEGSDTEFLAGLGLQVRAITLWGTYSTGDDDTSLAIGLSEWDFLKKVLPFFEK